MINISFYLFIYLIFVYSVEWYYEFDIMHDGHFQFLEFRVCNTI